MALLTLLSPITTLLIIPLTLGLYRIIYSFILSPLAGIPGPKLAALTGWYECYYDVFKPGQYVFKIKEMHKTYGPIVRIDPNEVSISDLGYIDTIYAPSPGIKRDKSLKGLIGNNKSVGGSVQHDLHRRRREALNPFFSKKSILGLAPQLHEWVSRLGKIFERSMERKGVLNLSDLYFALAGDVVSEYCFGYNNNVIDDPIRAATMRANVSSILRGTKINANFGWIQGIIRRLPQSIARHLVPKRLIEIIRYKTRIRQEIQLVVEAKDSKPSNRHRSIFYELRNSPTLPSQEKSVERLEDEAMLLVMAGTESTAKSISIAHYYLLSNPHIMAKLRTELSENPSTTLAEIDKLSYMNAIATEANRLSFGLTGRNSRISPTLPLQYTDTSRNKTYTIPAGTPLSASTLLVHSNEVVFPEPWTFDPERWIGPQGVERRKYMLAFSKGPRICIGINLANAELALTIAEIARWDMELYETSEDDVKFLHDYHVATPRLDSLGLRARVLRRFQS